MALKLVFKTHNANVNTIYDFATILNNRGFILNPKARGLKMNSTKNIVVDLKEGIYTPYALEYIIFADPVKEYVIELKD